MKGTPKSGWALRISGLTLFIAAILIQAALRFVPQDEMNGLLYLIGLLTLPMFLVGVFLFWRGRQYAARVTAENVLAKSGSRVLYLRPFRSDTSTLRYVFSSLLTKQMLSGLETEEEQLRDVLQPFGDVIAIGHPGESLPKPGAARLYASNEEWKDVVKGQMMGARLIVIRAGIGEGLLWELKEAIEVVDPQKLLILALLMKRKQYEAFRDKIEPIFRISLPRSDKLRRSFGRVSGFFTFSTNWEPRFLPLRGPYFRTSAYKPYRRLFRFALKPIFESSGVEWQAPPVSVSKVFATAILSLLGMLVLVFLYSGVQDWRSSRSNGAPESAVQAPTPHSQADSRYSAVAAALARLQDRLVTIPSVRARLEKIAKSSELSGLPPEETARRAAEVASEYDRKHARAGVRRLNDEALLTKLDLDQKLVTAADTAVCAAFARGRVSPEQLTNLLSRLEVPDIELYFDLIFRAAQADDQRLPARPVDRNRVNRSLNSILEALPEKDSQKLRRVLANSDQASDEEVCWTERTLRDAVARLGRSDRILWALSFVQ